MNDVMERVQKGAALLDDKRPGWHRDIDTAVGVFDLSLPTRCILGQLYGTFSIGAKALFGTRRCETFSDCPADHLDDKATTAHGFDRNGEGNYDELTAAWRELLAERR